MRAATSAGAAMAISFTDALELLRGGAVTVNWHPGEVATWLATLAANPGNPVPFLTNPVPVADAGFGMCTDGPPISSTRRLTE